MGVCYFIVNRTLQETIGFVHVGAGKVRELAGNPASAAIVTWYLLHHRGDEIAFVSDEDGDWPFSSGSAGETYSWPDVTEQVIKELLQESILQEVELRWQDPEEPELYIRGFQNTFGEYAHHPSKSYLP